MFCIIVRLQLRVTDITLRYSKHFPYPTDHLLSFSSFSLTRNRIPPPPGIAHLLLRPSMDTKIPPPPSENNTRSGSCAPLLTPLPPCHAELVPRPLAAGGRYSAETLNFSLFPFFSLGDLGPVPRVPVLASALVRTRKRNTRNRWEKKSQKEKGRALE